VLVADEDPGALSRAAALLEGLGHKAAARALGAHEAGAAITEADPDLALVRVPEGDLSGLDLLSEVADSASGPVIAVLDSEDPTLVAAAAERGIYAYARPLTPETVQGAIEVATRRQAENEALAEEVGRLETALDRRALIERAKGILMERHGVDDAAAFELLRGHARNNSRRVIDVARAVLDGHALLPKT
jgi:response regulator NasT